VEIDDPESEKDHKELTEATEGCFDKCKEQDPWLPQETKFKFEKRDTNTNSLKPISVAWNNCGVDDWIPKTYHFDIHHQVIQRTPDLRIKITDSKYTQLEKAEQFLTEVRLYQFLAGEDRSEAQIFEKLRPMAEEVRVTPEYNEHHTKVLKDHVRDCIRLFAPCYIPHIKALPLQNVVWCTDGTFHPKKLSIASPPKQDQRRKTVYHELGHYLEHICPEVGVFTNHLIRMKVGRLNRKKLINVMPGEVAMPVTDGSFPWIQDYAGKWYPRYHEELPNPTEVLSVYLEYFNSPEDLLILARHDPFMLKFVAFILMGGPIAAFEAAKNASLVKALDQIEQKNRPSRGYKYRSSGRRGYGGGSSYVPKRKDKKFGV
jgi:hypothetical protein